MANKPETKIVNDIQEYVEACGGNVLKLHGSAMQRRGEPDLIGGIPVEYRGVVWLIKFAVEVKLPGEEPRKLQLYRLQQWDKVGFDTGSVTSLYEFRKLMLAAARREYSAYGTD